MGTRAPLADVTVSSRYVKYALGLLLLVNILNFLDRAVVTILAESIKKDLNLADWQLGILSGLAFAMLYTALGIPIARYAERANRVRIIAVSVATWSCFTAACGAAQGFAQLVLARMGVGVGEAGCTPAAHSLISDYVAPQNRASAIAVYSMGTPIGSVLGLALGGFIAGAFGWRAAFIMLGLPGILLALLAFFTLKEPRTEVFGGATIERTNWRSAWSELRASRAFWLLALGVAATGVVGYGGGAFLPSFFFRNHGPELESLAADAGMSVIAFFAVWLGAAVGIAGVAGTWLGGFLADRLGSNNPRAYAYLPAVAAAIAYPLWIGSVLAPSVVPAIILMALANIMITVWPGPVFAAIHGIVRPRMRATASAVTLLVVNVIGLGVGPLALGIMSDLYANVGGIGAAEGVRWAEVSITFAGFVSIALFWAAGRAMGHNE